jgi:hypothetical protein
MKTIILLLVSSIAAFGGDSSSCSNETIAGNISISAPTFQSGIRTRQNTMKTIMKNISKFRMIYTERLRTGLRFEGKVIMKYGIDSRGTILFPSVDSTDISDTIFIRKLIENIKSWEYDPVSSIHDTSVVKYPFKFQYPNECKNNGINEEDAIRIAVKSWEQKFGKKQIAGEKPYLAVQRDTVWFVTGSLPLGMQGGTAKAEISERSGKILRIYHEQ